MTQKNRITYRFDHAGHSIIEVNPRMEKQQTVASDIAPPQSEDYIQAARPVKAKVIPLYPASELDDMREKERGDNSYQEDMAALEQLIRQAGEGQAESIPKKHTPPAFVASQVPPLHTGVHLEEDKDKEVAEAFNGAHHAYDNYKEADGTVNVYEEATMEAYRPTRMRRTAKGPSWFNVFLTVTAALATGALFGYMLLALFTGASFWPASSRDDVNSPTMANEDTPLGEAAGTNTNKGAGGSTVQEPVVTGAPPDSQSSIISLTGLNQTYYMLQFGVFSNLEGQAAAISQLADNGQAAAGMSGKSDYRVYAGMAGERSRAQMIRDMMPELDLYIKEVKLSAPSAFLFDGDAGVAQGFFEQTKVCIQMLDELVFAQLEQPSLSSIGEAAAKAWKTEHKKWETSAEAMQKGVSDENGKASMDQLTKAVNQAAGSMLEYDKKPSQAHLWSIQSALMEAIATQKEWFETNNAL